MSTTEHAEHADTGHAPGHTDEALVDPHDAHAEHKSDGYYVVVALILAAITALETSTYWVDFGPLFMPALLIMMTIKFVMVVSLFMHLKFDNKIFSYLFYTGLILAVFVYVAALATFRFFGSG
jgi:cytochrome c oxidase subunit 4